MSGMEVPRTASAATRRKLRVGMSGRMSGMWDVAEEEGLDSLMPEGPSSKVSLGGIVPFAPPVYFKFKGRSLLYAEAIHYMPIPDGQASDARQQ